MELSCRECGHVEADYLGEHLAVKHGLTCLQYTARYPDADFASPQLHAAVRSGLPKGGRQHPPALNSLYVEACNCQFPVHHRVPASACLSLPDHYRLPLYGSLAQDVQHAVTALWKVRSMYIWGLSGAGKDALFHWFSAATRTPGIKRQIKPGADIQSWFYNRSFDKDGTSWEEGPLLKALRDGYEVKDATGKVIERLPYLILFTDLDRADRSQAEHLRLILDSIEGQVEGPEGRTWPVLPGTRIVATGNTAGSGDGRGRYTSANVLDASLMERFDRVFQFSWLAWEDEEFIIRAKFPRLCEAFPGILEPIGRITGVLRSAILREELFAEFSHRSVCTVLGHAQDIMDSNTYKVDTLLRAAARAWLDRLTDEVTRESAKKLMDPFLKGGMLA